MSWVQTSSNIILDGNGVKAMPGLTPAPNLGSFNNLKNKENKGSQMGHTKKSLNLRFLST